MLASPRPQSFWWRISLLLVAVGWSASAYLFARVFTLLAPGKSAPLDLCSVLFSASCDQVLADHRFWILSIPLAGWGVVYFSTLAGLLLLARFVRGEFEARALFAGFTVTLAGVG